MTETNERTLDEQIALLLGWKPPGSEEAIRLAQERGVLREFAETNWMPPEDESWSFCIDWSIDIRKAWKLVDRMGNDFVALQRCWDYRWIGKFCDGVGLFMKTPDSTAPLAICRAFVAWEEGKEGK